MPAHGKSPAAVDRRWIPPGRRGSLGSRFPAGSPAGAHLPRLPVAARPTDARPRLSYMLGHRGTADPSLVRSLRRSARVLAGRFPATRALPPLPPQPGGARARPRSRSLRRHPPPHRAPLQVRPAPHLGGATRRLDATTRSRPTGRCRLRGASTAPSAPATSARLQPGGRAGRAFGTAGGPRAPPHRRHEPPDGAAGGPASRERPWGLCAGPVAPRAGGQGRYGARRLCRAGRRRRDDRGHARRVRPGAARMRCWRSSGAHAGESRSPRIAPRVRARITPSLGCRGARLARREEGTYRRYSTDEQRRCLHRSLLIRQPVSEPKACNASAARLRQNR